MNLQVIATLLLVGVVQGQVRPPLPPLPPFPDCTIRCQNNGFPDPIPCRCICTPGYFGEVCQFKVQGNIPPCIEVCQNGGRMDPVSRKCVCHPSGLYSGDRCEIVDCRGKSDQEFCDPIVKQWICLDPIISPACPVLCGVCPSVKPPQTQAPPTTCSSPPTVNNADVKVNGRVAYYTCRTGSSKTATAICQFNGSWTNPSLVCSGGTDVSNCFKMSGRTMVYRGTMSTTRTGLPCQSWTSNMPNRHSYRDWNFFNSMYPETAAQARNYCRDPSRSGRLWCYNRAGRRPRWDWCSDVPAC